MLAGSTMNTFVEPLENIFRTNKREGHLGDAFSSAQLGNAVFTTQPIQHNADFLLRTVLLTRLAFDVSNDAF